MNIQFGRNPAPFCGALLTVGNLAAGRAVFVSNGGLDDLLFGFVDPFVGWDDPGPRDFFNTKGARWICLGDIDGPGVPIARYGLDFGAANVEAPWSSNWAEGRDLIARIAVRTSPRSVPAIQVRAYRGTATDPWSNRTHELGNEYGITMIEHPIPASLDSSAESMRVQIHLPSGYIELPDNRLEILGVAIMLAPDAAGRPAPGTMWVSQGRGGWSLDDHLDDISQQSREALIRIADADHLLFMLGHNQDPGGIGVYFDGASQLIGLWEDAFVSVGRIRHSTTLVAPWATGPAPSTYYETIDELLRVIAADRRDRWVLSLLDLYQGVSPSVTDPNRYAIDGSGHPEDISTAWAMSQDLWCGLFPLFSAGCWEPPEHHGFRLPGQADALRRSSPSRSRSR
ncbi:MAG: hypothetical protein AB8F26_05680 [Phycisphaerales bacterium]